MTPDLPDTMDLLADLCGPGDRREAVEGLLIRKGVRYEKLTYTGGAVNFLFSFGSPWTWETVYGAHYDRVDDVPGANDNGAGVACLIRLAQQLQAENFQGPLAIVLFDKEEPCHRGRGAAGSLNFGKALVKKDCYPDLFVVLDVIGYGDALIYDSTSDERMVEMVKTVSPSILPRRTPGSDDALLDQVGINSILLCALPGNELADPYPMTWNLLHTSEDDLESVESENIHHVQRLLYEMLQPDPQVIPDIAPYLEPEPSFEAWSS